MSTQGRIPFTRKEEHHEHSRKNTIHPQGRTSCPLKEEHNVHTRICRKNAKNLPEAHHEPNNRTIHLLEEYHAPQETIPCALRVSAVNIFGAILVYLYIKIVSSCPCFNKMCHNYFNLFCNNFFKQHKNRAPW